MARPIQIGGQQTTVGLPIQETGPFAGVAYRQPDSSSVARGVDNLQASLYAFANIAGQGLNNLTGIDALEKWGEEGILRNLDEAAMNPPTIREWDDVESLSDFFTYFAEAVGEQLPQLGFDAAAAVAGGLTGAGIGTAITRRAAMTTAQKAAMGKALKRKVGEGAFSEFLKRRSVQRGLVGGIGLSNLAQNSGETQINFMQRGIDAPGTALMAGAVKGALDTVSPVVLGKLVAKTGVPAGSLPQLFGNVLKGTIQTGAAESVTEGAQTLVDHIATRIEDPTFDPFSIEALKEIREAMIKGGIVGVTLGGTTTGLTETAAYRRAKTALANEVDQNDPFLRELLRTGPPRERTPVPESQDVIDAQARLITDESSSRDSLFLPPGSPPPSPGILPDTIQNIELRSGLLLTNNPAKAEEAEQLEPDQEEAFLGRALYDREGGLADTDGVAIVVRDRAGVPVLTIGSSLNTLEQDMATARAQAPAGSSIRVSSADNVLRERVSRASNQQQGPVPIADEILAELGINQTADAEPVTADPDDRSGLIAVALMDALKKRIPDEAEREQMIELLDQPDNLLDEQTRPVVNALRQDLLTDLNERLTRIETLEAQAQRDDALAAEQQITDEGVTDTVTPLSEQVEQDYDGGIDFERTADRSLLQGISVVENDQVDAALASDTLITPRNDGNAVPDAQGRRTPRPEPVYIEDAIKHAAYRGQQRDRIASRATGSKQETIKRSLFRVSDPDGNVVIISAPQLTSAGEDVLYARGVSPDDRGVVGFRREAFLTMLGELKARGYSVPDNINAFPADFLPWADITYTTGRIRPNKNGSPNATTFGEMMEDMARRQEQTVAESGINRLQGARRQARRAENQVPPDFNQIERAQTVEARVQRQYDEAVAADPADQTQLALMEEGQRDTGPRSVQDQDSQRDASGAYLSTLDTAAGRVGVDSSAAQRDAARAQIEADVANFLKQGGTIRSEVQSTNRKTGSKVYGFGASITQSMTDFVRGVLDEIGLVNINMAVADPGSLAEMQRRGYLTEQQRVEAEAKLKHANVKAVFVPNGDTGTIIIKPASDSREAQQNRLAILGHETGHAVFNSIYERINNPQNDRDRVLADRLRSAFEAERDRSEIQAYAAQDGFREWFADKISARARGIITSQPKSLVEKFFAQSADLLRKTYNAVKGRIHPRFHRNKTFESVIDAFKADNVFDNVRTIDGDGRIETMDERPWRDKAFMTTRRGKVRGLEMGRLAQADLDLVDDILNAVGFGNLEVIVATPEHIDTLAEMGFLDRDLANELRQEAENTPTWMQGWAIFSNEHPIIVLPDASPTDGPGLKDRQWTIGHETGHFIARALVNDFINRGTTANSFLDLYGRSFRRDAYYSTEGKPSLEGFEEWFSDQIANEFVLADNSPVAIDEPALKQLFRSIYEALRDVFDFLVKRFGPLDSSTQHEAYVYFTDRMAPRQQRDAAFRGFLDTVIDSKFLAEIKDIRQGARLTNFSRVAAPLNNTPPVTPKQLAAAIRGMLDPRKAFGISSLFDVDNQLRAMGLESIADLIYQPTNSQNTEAYWTLVENATNQWFGRINQILPRKLTQAQADAIFFQLAQELPDAQLTPEAMALRNLIKEFHGYITEVIPNIGELQNYFPRNYNGPALLARAEEFLTLLEQHGINRNDGQQILNNLTKVHTVDDSTAFVPKRSFLHKHRELSDPDLVRAMVDAGFLNANPKQALESYLRRSIRRVELERKFGGYKYMQKWTKIGSSQYNANTALTNQAILATYLQNWGYDLVAMTPDQALQDAIKMGHVVMDSDGNPQWRDPTVGLIDMLSKETSALNMSDADKVRVYKLTRHALDTVDPLDPTSTLYNFTGELRAFESLRTLAFSGIASIPEIGVTFARAKGAMNIPEFARLVADTIKNFGELREFTEAIGAIHRDVSDALLTEMLLDQNEGKGRFFRRALGPMFKLNGNAALVDFTRVVATAVGKQFLIQNVTKVRTLKPGSMAHDRATRYLAELGIDTPDKIDGVWAWMQASEAAGKALIYNDPSAPLAAETLIVQNALNRFINESVIKPNSAERPTWARHPIGGLVFHLKTFQYSYSKNVLGGMYREAKARYAEGDTFESMLPYYIAAVGVFIALGAVGDELRNRIKSLGEKGTWTANREDVGQMTAKWFDRAGFTSLPFMDAIPIPGVQAVGASDIAFSLGPTASHLFDLFADDLKVDRNEVVRSIPLVSQMDWARQAAYDAVRKEK